MGQGRRDWGHHMWPTLHFVAMGYPEMPTEEERSAYREFFVGIGSVLPCKRCAPHFRQVLKDIPIDPYLAGRKELFTWTVLLHNAVNRSLGKPIWDVDKAWAEYNGDDNAGKSSSSWHRVLLVALLVIVLFVAVSFWRGKRVSRTR